MKNKYEVENMSFISTKTYIKDKNYLIKYIGPYGLFNIHAY